MSALPRPGMTGPARVLNDALHDLHHQAGWPSLRALAKETGVSHTTVSKAFSRPDLPTWGTLELLVDAMDGDTSRFHDLWLSASSPTRSTGDRPPTARIAGRHTELDVVRRHLESGTGLLLVTGEAGIGKTTLVLAAASTSATEVAIGNSLPLSSEIPMLPVADALRSLMEADGGARLQHALAHSPLYVAAAITALLPEVAATSRGAPVLDDRSLLFTAVSTLLRTLDAEGATALLVEDLHWADGATLDLLEHLLGRGAPVAVVGTWRSGDESTPQESEDWLGRVRMRADTTMLALGPLTREETAQQLALVRDVTPDQVARIHARSLGQPLFTEQLAATLDDEDGFPSLLADLLDRRLSGLAESSWALVRLLGIAARPLDASVLAEASRLEPELVTRELHVLRDRRLVRTSGDAVDLQHPLLAEAVQRRVVTGEETSVHAALARALGARSDAEPAEVAEHWRRAGDRGEELIWRIAAARAAQARFANPHAFAEWSRVIELRRAGLPFPGGAEVTDGSLYIQAFDTGVLSSDPDDMVVLLDEGLVLDLSIAERAALLRRSGDLAFSIGRDQRGLELLDEALELHVVLGASAESAHARQIRSLWMRQAGRWDEAVSDIGKALEEAQLLDDPHRLRSALHVAAGLHAELGRGEEARRLMARAHGTRLRSPNPLGDIFLAADATDLLLVLGGDLEEVDAAAALGFASAERWGLDIWSTNTLRYNVALAYVRAGRTGRAAEIVQPVRDRPLTFATRNGHVAVGFVDLRRGDVDSAHSRLTAVGGLGGSESPAFLEDDLHRAEVEAWLGRHEDAVARLRRAVAILLPTGAARIAAPYLVWLARSEADRLESSSPQERDEVAQDLEARVARATTHPLGDQAVGCDVRAHAAQWRAELSRVRGADTGEAWSLAAAEWDLLGRPHDAAYARWRGAQRALRDGQGTVAARLLRRAAVDAREHVPLSRAIARTAGR